MDPLSYQLGSGSQVLQSIDKYSWSHVLSSSSRSGSGPVIISEQSSWTDVHGPSPFHGSGRDSGALAVGEQDTTTTLEDPQTTTFTVTAVDAPQSSFADLRNTLGLSPDRGSVALTIREHDPDPGRHLRIDTILNSSWPDLQSLLRHGYDRGSGALTIREQAPLTLVEMLGSGTSQISASPSQIYSSSGPLNTTTFLATANAPQFPWSHVLGSSSSSGSGSRPLIISEHAATHSVAHDGTFVPTQTTTSTLAHAVEASRVSK